MDLNTTRRLAHFPGFTSPDQVLDFNAMQQFLRRPRGDAMLVHGGRGSGKTELLEALAAALNKAAGVFMLPSFNMSDFAGQPDPIEIFRAVVKHVAAAARLRLPKDAVLPGDLDRQNTSELQQSMTSLLDLLKASKLLRIILPFDDFDRVDPYPARFFAQTLVNVFKANQQVLGLVLTTSTYMSEWYRNDHVASPFSGVTESFLLLGWTAAQTRQYAREKALARYGQKPDGSPALELNALDLDALAEQSYGYPILIDNLLELLAQNRPARSGYPVEAAAREIRQHYYRYEPLHTMYYDIEELAGRSDSSGPASLLYKLANRAGRSGDDGELLDPTHDGVKLLLAMGVLRWAGSLDDHRLVWSNEIIRLFWTEEEGVGSSLLQRWARTPIDPLNDNRLNAHGTLLVHLLMDLGEIIEAKDSFDEQRGSLAWVKKLKTFGQEHRRVGKFKLWDTQDYLANLGQDINLFRMQIIEQSVTPVFEADVDDLAKDYDFKQRIKQVARELSDDKVAEIDWRLHVEWARWTSVRIAFTRGGAAAVTLVRQVKSGKPLLQLMNDLLGLESELIPALADNQIELSMQWELVLAVISSFFRQVQQQAETDRQNLAATQPELGAHPRPAKAGLDIQFKEYKETTYPERDRYVIYQFYNLCTCLVPNSDPGAIRDDFITASHFDVLADPGKANPQKLEAAEEYGRELAGIMEGVLVTGVDPKDDKGYFPRVKTSGINELLKADASSWRDELFIISLDNALLLYPTLKQPPPELQGVAEEWPGAQPPGENHSPHLQQYYKNHVYCRTCHRDLPRRIGRLYFPNRSKPVEYEDYWAVVTMGLQYLLELRWTAQWVTRQTAAELENIAGLMHQEVTARSRPEMKKIESHVALYTRLLSQLREAANPRSIATADYAVNKYEHFIEISHIREVIENGEKDIQMIQSFMQRDQDLYEENRTTQIESIFALGGVILAIFGILVQFPNLWVDASGNSFITRIFRINPGGAQYLAVLSTVELFLLLALPFTAYWIYRKWKFINKHNPRK